MWTVCRLCLKLSLASMGLNALITDVIHGEIMMPKAIFEILAQQQMPKNRPRSAIYSDKMTQRNLWCLARWWYCHCCFGRGFQPGEDLHFDHYYWKRVDNPKNDPSEGHLKWLFPFPDSGIFVIPRRVIETSSFCYHSSKRFGSA